MKNQYATPEIQILSVNFDIMTNSITLPEDVFGEDAVENDNVHFFLKDGIDVD